MARCPAGTKAVAGGFVRDSWYRNGYGESTDDIMSNGATMDGSGWFTQQFHGKTVARALCS
ncbi:hypothetical protein [Streptomyces sp. NPDC059168]|uniref:hypothetical protein n=1 Tax=Streptomyces sp. NPDC059168 TaxID=3346753 RepID=UPI00367444DE